MYFSLQERCLLHTQGKKKKSIDWAFNETTAYGCDVKFSFALCYNEKTSNKRLGVFYLFISYNKIKLNSIVLLSARYLKYYAFATHAKYLITHYTRFPAFLFSEDIIFSPSRLYYFLHISYCIITRILHLFRFIESSFANNLVMTVLISFCTYHILVFLLSPTFVSPPPLHCHLVSLSTNIPYTKTPPFSLRFLQIVQQQQRLVPRLRAIRVQILEGIQPRRPRQRINRIALQLRIPANHRFSVLFIPHQHRFQVVLPLRRCAQIAQLQLHASSRSLFPYHLRNSAERHVFLVHREANRPRIANQQRERRFAPLLAVGTIAIVGEQHAAEELREALADAELANGALRGDGGLHRERSEAMAHAGEVGSARNVEPEGAFEGRSGGIAATVVSLRGKGEMGKRWCSGERAAGGRGRSSSCSRRCWWERRRGSCSGCGD